MGYDIPGLGSNEDATVVLTNPVIKNTKSLGSVAVLSEIYVSPNGSDAIGDGSFTNPVATLGKAMTMVTSSKLNIILMAGDYAEDVTWCNTKNVVVSAMIAGTVTLSAVTAFAIKVDPTASSGTWTFTIQGCTISNDDGLKGLWVNNTNVGKRINAIINDCDFESETSTDKAIDVDRAGAGTDSIRMYIRGRNHTIEGLVDFITESTDDRLRFFGMRLIGGVAVTGNIVMEVAYACCGIQTTSGESYGTGNVSGHFACWNETDANPNVYTALSDDDETSH
jgi:hypothetical protein